VDVRRIAGFVLLAHLGAGQLLWANAKYDPARPPQPLHSRRGFLDFTLGQINQSDQDYGQAVAIERNRLSRETINNGYFWSNLVALALLGLLFFVVSYQQRRTNRAAWDSAEVVARYEHALQRANAQIADASRRNHDLIHCLTKLRETVVLPESDHDEPSDATLSRETRKRQAEIVSFVPDTPRSKPAKPTKNSATGSADVPAAPGTQIGLFKSEVDFIVKINSLEQQLAQHRDVEKELHRQLNEAERKVQAEQGKNRTLKGG
jgi:hypothetical protein